MKKETFSIAAIICMLLYGCSFPDPGADIPLTCDCECEPVSIVVADAESFIEVPQPQVLVLRWSNHQWQEILSCGSEASQSNADLPSGEVEHASDFTSCFFQPVSGLYQFVVSAEGYTPLEKRVRIGEKTVDFEFCNCDCSAIGNQVFELTPLS